MTFRSGGLSTAQPSWCLSFLLVFAIASPIHAEDESLDSLMYHDPELPKAKIVRALPPDLISAWLVALHRPEADYQCRAALTIVLAHQAGIQGLERTVAALLEVIEQPNHHALARLSAARALVELDARQAAEPLLRQAKAADHDLRDLIEPALAAWKYKPAREMWLERLSRAERQEPGAKGANQADSRFEESEGAILISDNGDFVLALRGLAALQEAEAAPRLAKLVDSDQVSWPNRLEAARALGAIRTSGSEPQARRLLVSHPSRFQTGVGEEITSAQASSRLAAAWLLSHHQGEEAVKLLQGLARDPEPAIVFVALQRLLEIDSKLALPALETALTNPDAKVRALGVETLYREPTIERLRPLADKLDDPHPDVRVKARQSLQNLASKSQFRNEVIQQGVRILAGQDWRGQEQATILLARLDHKPAAKRIAELLKSERSEVMVATGWGLRRLAVPETLPAALAHFRSIQGNVNVPIPIGKITEAWDLQLSHLAQFMGQSRYRAAEADLRRQVPRFKNPFKGGPETRAASIWSLGLLHEGESEPSLAQEVEDRLKDAGRPFIPPEDVRIRWMSAITLGRMKSKESLPSLRRFQATATPTLDPLAHACSWAVQQLTGEAPPAPGTVELPLGAFVNWLRSIAPKPETGRLGNE
jgi:HEAT repeat protein